MSSPVCHRTTRAVRCVLLYTVCMVIPSPCLLFFFFNDTATTEIYTLSLHDALPIFPEGLIPNATSNHYFFDPLNKVHHFLRRRKWWTLLSGSDRKSTRLNSSHANISYAVFCLKKKKTSKQYER